VARVCPNRRCSRPRTGSSHSRTRPSIRNLLSRSLRRSLGRLDHSLGHRLCNRRRLYHRLCNRRHRRLYHRL